ncbi:MAG TPA: GldG family protein [Candidatus Kryptonia bacterium]
MKKSSRDSIVQLVLYFAVVVLANVVASNLFLRIDLTRDRVNTLSSATEALLRSLKDNMIVRVYFNSDLPSPYVNNRRALVDMLQELRSLSGGKLEYEIYDPTSDADVNKAMSDGIPQIQVQVVNNDKLEVKRAFMGMVIEYRARKQSLPVIEDLSNFEYEVASRIDRLINPNRKTIAIAQGNGEPAFSDIQKAQDALTSRYILLPVNFSAPVPDSVSALILIQPTTIFADSQLYNLDQYMMNRGRAAFLMGMSSASMQSQYASDLPLNLNGVFGSYGFNIRKDLVRDAACASVSVMQREGGFTIQTALPNPYIPIVSNFDKSFTVTQNLHQIVFPFASEVDTSFAHGLHLNVTPFAFTSDHSGIQTGFYNLDPTVHFTQDMFLDHHLLLGAAISGKIHTAVSDSDRFAIMNPDRRKEGTERIVVMGNGNFIRDVFLSNPENLSVFLNTADYLADDLGLVSIRSKSFLPPPLKPVSEGARATTKDSIIAIPPLLVLVLGLVYWRRSVNRRKAYQASLADDEENKNEEVN